MYSLSVFFSAHPNCLQASLACASVMAESAFDLPFIRAMTFSAASTDSRGPLYFSPFLVTCQVDGPVFSYAHLSSASARLSFHFLSFEAPNVSSKICEMMSSFDTEVRVPRLT